MCNLQVSIICTAYNQEKYIKSCLDGFVMQKTNFNFEVLISDDASTDNTAQIIKEYADKYPDIIKPIYFKENQYAKQISIWLNHLIPKATGKYLAFCDGDDYWTDPYKLQKQVDFLEKHKDYSMCFHQAKTVYVDDDLPDDIWPKLKNPTPDRLFKKLISNNFICSNSTLYRFDVTTKKELINAPNNIYPRDWYHHIIVAIQGKMGFLPEVMSVYRRNSQGISYTTSSNHVEELHTKYGIKEVNFYYEIMNRVKERYLSYEKEIFMPRLKEILIAYMKNNMLNEVQVILDKYEKYISDINISEIHNSNNKKYKKYRKLFNIFLSYSILMTCTVSFMLWYILHIVR